MSCKKPLVLCYVILYLHIRSGGDTDGKRRQRTAKNATAAGSFWLDIDCGEGKYSGEAGIVMSDGNKINVKDGKCMPATPMVKLGNTQREIPVNANILKLKNDRDIVQAERAHHEEKGPKKHLATPFNVGDIVVTNGNKTYGYVFEAA